MGWGLFSSLPRGIGAQSRQRGFLQFAVLVASAIRAQRVVVWRDLYEKREYHMNSAPGIILTRAEHAKLESLATGLRVPRSLSKRAQAILACAKGNTNLVVAGEIGLTNLTVGRWRKEFLLNRLKDFGVERRVRPLRPLILSSAERRTLQGWLRSRPVSIGLAARARVILACARGKSNIAGARATEVSEITVGKLRQRFLADGLIGLRPARPGRPATPVVLTSDKQGAS